jgi:secreted Zn-dependent insulinase-like peptidase
MGSLSIGRVGPKSTRSEGIEADPRKEVPMRTRSLPFGLMGVVVLTLATCGAEAPAADEPTSFSLENGLRVRLVPLEGEERVFVILAVQAGFLDEPAGLPHLAHVTEHLVVFGAPGGSDEAEATERWFRAGRANGETLPGWMYFDLQVESGELEAALRVQAIRLARPEFTGDILSREIPRTLQELGGFPKRVTRRLPQSVLRTRVAAPAA